MNSEKIIEVKNLVKRFGHFTANDNLTFDVYKGEIFGFLGANGAGKTTAMKILCGIIKAYFRRSELPVLMFTSKRKKLKRILVI